MHTAHSHMIDMSFASSGLMGAILEVSPVLSLTAASVRHTHWRLTVGGDEPRRCARPHLLCGSGPHALHLQGTPVTAGSQHHPREPVRKKVEEHLWGQVLQVREHETVNLAERAATARLTTVASGAHVPALMPA